jgi:hypothetical protein
MTKLKLYSGDAGDMGRLICGKSYDNIRAYVAAHSRADACSMIGEIMSDEFISIKYMSDYCDAVDLEKQINGRPMRDIPNERGIWLRYFHLDFPVRVFPKDTK